MPRLCSRSPAYRKHKASGQAVVTLGGRVVYLGPYGSKTSHGQYDRVVAEYLAAGRRAFRTGGGQRGGVGGDDLRICELCAAFWKHAKSYYRHADGTPTSEVETFRAVLCELNQLYGDTPAAEFGPLAMEAVRLKMIQKEWCRTQINRQMARLRMVFKWAVSKELVPASVHHGLVTVSALRAGRSAARESDPVKPVSEQAIDATLPFLSSTVAAMVQVQRLTGARPGEICAMRTGDIGRGGAVWTYTPPAHKTAHRGHCRTIWIGPRAQAILAPLLKLDPAAYVFSPAEAEEQRRQALHQARKTPLSYGNRPGTNCKRKPKRQPSDQYDVAAYNRAVVRACELAFPISGPLARRIGEGLAAWKARLTPEQRQEVNAWRRANGWHVHQLRHSAATEVRKLFGIEGAQHVLGHRTISTTQLYAEKNNEVARQIAAKIG